MLRPLAAAGILIAAGAVASAATVENFELRNGGDLLALCSATPGEPHYAAAIHKCQGYGLGAWHYYLAVSGATPGQGFVCIREPRPSRDQVAAGFVAWGRSHPQYHAEPAVEMFFRFLAETYPCER